MDRPYSLDQDYPDTVKIMIALFYSMPLPTNKVLKMGVKTLF